VKMKAAGNCTCHAERYGKGFCRYN